MAKHTKSEHEQDGEISFTMVKFSMKASDAGLQKGIDAIRSAFAQAGISLPQQEHRQLRSNGAKHVVAGLVHDSAEVEVAEEVIEADTEEHGSEAAPARKQSAPRKLPSYKIMNELVFDDVEPTLAEFCTTKNPQTDLDKYKCIASWFKKYKDTPDLTVPHFFTAYKILGWKPPRNPAQPVSDLRKDQLLVSGEKHGTSSISIVGEGQVQALPKDAT